MKVNEAILDMITEDKMIPQLKTVPTTSAYEKTACQIINEELLVHPEWIPTISALVSYPVQEWAVNVRKGMNLDSTDIAKAISSYDAEEYLGFKTVGKLKQQEKNMENTDSILALTNEILYGKCDSSFRQKQQMLRTVHGTKACSSSAYLMKSYYKAGIEDVCEQNNAMFTAMLKSMSNESDELDWEIKAVYHDTDKLFRLIPLLTAKKHDRQYELDYEDTSESLMECIKSLKSYPVADGETIYKVMKLYAEGYTQTMIMEKLHKSQTYVSKRYTNGIRALSILLWGMTCRDIISMLNAM